MIELALAHVEAAAECADNADSLHVGGHEPEYVMAVAAVAQAHAAAAQALVACLELAPTRARRAPHAP